MEIYEKIRATYLIMFSYSLSFPLESLNLLYMTEASTLAGLEVFGSFSSDTTDSRIVLKIGEAVSFPVWWQELRTNSRLTEHFVLGSTFRRGARRSEDRRRVDGGWICTDHRSENEAAFSFTFRRIFVSSREQAPDFHFIIKRHFKIR